MKFGRYLLVEEDGQYILSWTDEITKQFNKSIIPINMEIIFDDVAGICTNYPNVLRCAHEFKEANAKPWNVAHIYMYDKNNLPNYDATGSKLLMWHLGAFVKYFNFQNGCNVSAEEVVELLRDMTFKF